MKICIAILWDCHFSAINDNFNEILLLYTVIKRVTSVLMGQEAEMLPSGGGKVCELLEYRYSQYSKYSQ